MRMQPIIAAFDALKAKGLIDSYAIGGAVGATFYLEPVATVDVDVFITLAAAAGEAIIDPTPLFRFLTSMGHSMDGEYVVISGWPVQFLAAGVLSSRRRWSKQRAFRWRESWHAS